MKSNQCHHGKRFGKKAFTIFSISEYNQELVCPKQEPSSRAVYQRVNST